MLNSYYDNANQKAKVVMLYGWLAYDVFLTGLIVYTTMVLQIHTFATTLDAVEKFILFLCTIAFAGYRIYILHLDAEKKKLDNQQQKDEMKEKEAEAGLRLFHKKGGRSVPFLISFV